MRSSLTLPAAKPTLMTIAARPVTILSPKARLVVAAHGMSMPNQICLDVNRLPEERRPSPLCVAPS